MAVRRIKTACIGKISASHQVHVLHFSDRKSHSRLQASIQEGKAMIKLTRSQGAVILTGFAAASMIAMPLAASPGGGIAATNLSTVTLEQDFQANHDRVKLQTMDPMTVRMQRLDFSAGGHTGFHHHPGAVIVSVVSGTVTLVDGHDCGTKDYGPGSANGSIFIEADDHAHEAVSANGAVVFVTYIVPNNNGSPSFREEEEAPFCAQSF
jgi:quercetin dioxygenase-like cupin family protein